MVDLSQEVILDRNFIKRPKQTLESMLPIRTFHLLPPNTRLSILWKDVCTHNRTNTHSH